MMLTSKENNKALENVNDKFLEIMNVRGLIASYLLFPLSKITNPEITSQFRLVKDASFNRVHDLILHNTMPVTLYNNWLTFRDTGKIIELKGDLLKMITNKNYNVDVASLVDKKMLYDFAEEKFFDVKVTGNKSTRDRSPLRLLKSTALMASGFSTTYFTGKS